MVLNIVLKKIKSFLLLFTSILRRALCCFRRRRLSNDFVPLTQIGVVPDDNTVQTSDADFLTDWNEPLAIRTTKPNTIDEHIQFYRQKTIAARQIHEEFKPTDDHFFEDMTPTIIKQTKYFINDSGENSDNTNRLSLAPENVNLVTKDLEEWDDNTGWEDETLNLDAKQALIESRRQARQKKMWEQQQRRHEKVPRPVLGAKVYT